MDEFVTHLLHLSDPGEVENAVAHLPYEQLLKLLPHLKKAPAEKIAPIIAGLTLPSFKELLTSSAPFFKEYAHKEALHHKIACVMQEEENKLTKLYNQHEGVQNRIEQFPISPILDSPLNNFREELSALSQEVGQSLHLLNLLLELSWLSQRIDLIELLNQLKKRYIHLELYHQMLLEQFKNRLNLSFEAQDQSSALEALTTLGLSYEGQWRDLLSSLGENVAELGENDLLTLLERRLNQAGLNTVEDFKQRAIYTQEELLRQL